MTQRNDVIARLVKLGFERLPSIGTRYTGFTRRGNGTSYNVDVGPRGAVACWRVYIDQHKSVVSTRMTLDDLLTTLTPDDGNNAVYS